MDRQAAIFDFDSRFFGAQASWRIRDPRIGMSGAVRDPGKVFEFLSEHRGSKDFRLADHFQHLDPGFIDSTLSEGFAFLPQEHLGPTAQQHRFRGRDLFLLTYMNEAGMEDLLKEVIRQTFEQAPGQRSHLPYQRGNPLDSAEILELRPQDLHGVATAKDLPLARFRRIRSLLSIKDGPQAERPGPYDRVFVYTSDPVLALLMDQFITAHQDQFVAGRNALMPSLIARVSEEALSAGQKANV